MKMKEKLLKIQKNVYVRYTIHSGIMASHLYGAWTDFPNTIPICYIYVNG